MAAQTFFSEFAFDDILGGNASMIHSRKPQRVETLHPLPSHDHIVNRVIEHVTHMQGAGDIRRRYYNRENGPIGFRIGTEIAS